VCIQGTECVSRGRSVYKEYVEEGSSAHTVDLSKRPAFRLAIDEALSGHYDVLVVHKIDRFSRKLRITLEYLEKLGKAGVASWPSSNRWTMPDRRANTIIYAGSAC
jgi:DNA invertase Pin-like site-specific DNA recombinase